MTARLRDSCDSPRKTFRDRKVRMLILSNRGRSCSCLLCIGNVSSYLGAREAASKEQDRDRRNHGDGEKDETRAANIPHSVHTEVPTGGKTQTPRSARAAPSSLP